MLAALSEGPVAVRTLASALGCREVDVRNAIDAARRSYGRGIIVALGGGVFTVPEDVREAAGAIVARAYNRATPAVAA